METTPWTSSPAAGIGQSGSITLVDGNTFLVGSTSGDIDRYGTEGLFMLDTRVLATWRLTIDGHGIEAVSSLPNGPFSITLVGRTRSETRAESDLAVIRRRHLGHGMREDVELRHYGREPRQVVLGLEIASDFASLFEVKAGHHIDAELASPILNDVGLRIRPAEASSLTELLVDFEPAPARLVDDRVEWDLTLQPGRHLGICIEVAVRIGDVITRPSHRCGQPIEEAIPVGRMASWRSAVPTLRSTDDRLTQAFDQSLEDLGALRIFDPDHTDRIVVAAGAPWFMTLFGRDALLTGWMALLVDHDIARGVLASLADTQGRRSEPRTEEQPGRILHEVRFDHRSSRTLGGHNIYYGTIDATPLFVMLTAELARWSGDHDLIASLLPSVDRAMAWMDTDGDRDGDGFLEYIRSTPHGLENQGWKDSWDGIRFGDGSVARAPIALCEVQAYTYGAMRARADLAAFFSDDVGERHYDGRADALAKAFDEAFWMPAHHWYSVGLDHEKRQIDSLTSNLGHCLWTRIIPPERVERIASLLTSPALFSGWGLRTLSAEEAGFNPLSYHCGSVWPHDTAIAIAGLAANERDDEAARLMSALLDAATSAGGRLPELFAGFDRVDLPAPVAYPASCCPQAWAAAAPLLILRSMLGLEPDLIHRQVRIRPRIPSSMGHVHLDGVPIGNHRVTIDAGPDGATIRGLPAEITLIVS